MVPQITETERVKEEAARVQEDETKIKSFRTGDDLEKERKHKEEIEQDKKRLNTARRRANSERRNIELSESSDILDSRSKSTERDEKNQLSESGTSDDFSFAEDYWSNRDVVNTFDTISLSGFSYDQVIRSKKELVKNILKLVCERLNAQTAAIFLMSKNGILERTGIYGYHKNGAVLDEDWFSNEHYELGISFTGKVAKPKDNQNYGKISYTKNLNNEELSPQSKEEYNSTFGDLRCAIGIPLNGRNKTYGVLRVVNKVDEKKRLSEDSFSKDDVMLLLFLATPAANALSNFRRDVQADILKRLSHLLIQPCHDLSSLKLIYQQVVDSLVQNPETAFKAAIFRVFNEDGFLIEEAHSLAEGVTDDRDHSPRKPSDDQFLSIPIEEKKRWILEDIKKVLKDDELRHRFVNHNWIRKNSFQGFACFPLVSKDETLGTLSLYTGYNYEFHSNSVEFIQNVTDLMAAFISNIKTEREKLEADKLASLKIKSHFQSLANEWTQDTEFLSSTIQMSTHPAYQQIIGLGQAAVPLLLNELYQNPEPDHWFWALSAITGEDPVQPEQEGKIKQMKQAWLEWGEKQGYVFEESESSIS